MIDMTPLETFAEFWAVYPRHVGKKAAIKAWLKINPSQELLTRILADLAARHQAAEIARAAGKWWPAYPHASTYLNGERWEDEAEAAPAGIYDGLAAFARDES